MATVQFGKPPGGAKNVRVNPTEYAERVQMACPSGALGAVLTADKRSKIEKILLVETNNVAATVDIKLAPLGAADAAAHFLFQDVPVAAKETVVIEGPFHMLPTDVLRMLATTANVSVHVSYLEQI